MSSLSIRIPNPIRTTLTSLRRRAPGLAGMALAFALPVVMAGSAEAFVCKGTYTSVHSSGFAKPVVMAKARTLWSSTVVAKYGDIAWGVWDIAASKSQSCSQSGAKWTCTAKAKPCLYVVP